MNYFLSYAGMTVVFFLIDMLWLGVIAKSYYRKHLGELLLENFNWIAAFSFYFLFLAGLFIFAVLPAFEKHSWIHAIFLGGFFGFFCYATYDLTNWATLKNWPWQIVWVDIIWGFVLSAIVSFVGFFILEKIS